MGILSQNSATVSKIPAKLEEPKPMARRQFGRFKDRLIAGALIATMVAGSAAFAFDRNRKSEFFNPQQTTQTELRINPDEYSKAFNIRPRASNAPERAGLGAVEGTATEVAKAAEARPRAESHGMDAQLKGVESRGAKTAETKEMGQDFAAKKAGISEITAFEVYVKRHYGGLSSRWYRIWKHIRKFMRDQAEKIWAGVQKIMAAAIAAAVKNAAQLVESFAKNPGEKMAGAQNLSQAMKKAA